MCRFCPCSRLNKEDFFAILSTQRLNAPLFHCYRKTKMSAEQQWKEEGVRLLCTLSVFQPYESVYIYMLLATWIIQDITNSWATTYRIYISKLYHKYITYTCFTGLTVDVGGRLLHTISSKEKAVLRPYPRVPTRTECARPPSQDEAPTFEPSSLPSENNTTRPKQSLKRLPTS